MSQETSLENVYPCADSSSAELCTILESLDIEEIRPTSMSYLTSSRRLGSQITIFGYALVGKDKTS